MKDDPAGGAAALHRARARLPERRTRAEPARRTSTSAVRTTTAAIDALRQGDDDQPVVLAALQSARLRVSLHREVRRGREDVQEIHRADPRRSESLRLVCRAADEDAGASTSRSRRTRRRCRSTRTSWRPTSGSATTICSWDDSDEARATFTKIDTVARNTGEHRLAHFWTAASYVSRRRDRQGDRAR